MGYIGVIIIFQWHFLEHTKPCLGCLSPQSTLCSTSEYGYSWIFSSQERPLVSFPINLPWVGLFLLPFLKCKSSLSGEIMKVLFIITDKIR